jgi:hypothetical protein
MKKKLLLGVTGLTLLFSLTLVGCPQPSDPEPEKTLVVGAGGLIARAEDGVNYIWWNSPKGSGGIGSTWGIYRRDTVTQELKNLNTASVTQTSSWYAVADAVDWDNQLINGRKYEYTVWAGASGSEKTEDKITIQARVPARTPGLTFELTADDIDVQQFKSTSGDGDMLLVTFPNQPNLTYEVSYTYGKKAEMIRDFGGFAMSDSSGLDNWFAPVRAATFPLIGGTNTIAVKATFVGNKSTASAYGRYYAEAPEVYTQTTFTTAPELAAVTNFTASQTQDTVRFTWNSSDLTVSDFEVYKVEVNQYFSDVNDPGNGISIPATGDWRTVPLGKSLTGILGGPEKKWQAYETVTAQEKFYVYAVVAKKGDAKSSPIYATAQKLNVASPDNFNLQVVNNQVQLTWTAKTGYTYKLESAQVKSKKGPGYEADYFSEDNNDYELVTDYQNVSQTPGIVQNAAVVFHAPAVNKNHIYRLTPVLNGVEGKPVYKIINQQNWATVVYFSPVQDPSHPEDLANTIRLRLRDPSTGTRSFDRRDYIIELYYRETTNPQTTFKQVPGSVPGLTSADWSSGGSIINWTYLHTSLDLSKQYEYKVVAKVGTQEIYAGDDYGTLTGTSVPISPIVYGQDIRSGTYYSTAASGYPANSLELIGNNLSGLQVLVSYSGGTSVSAIIGSAGSGRYYITPPTTLATGSYYYVQISNTSANVSGGGSFYKP